jgi:hypothetical protein
MKITKRLLRRIIKEELCSTLIEGLPEDIAADQARRGFKPSPTGTPSANQYDPNGDPEDEYIKLIKTLGPRSFVQGLIRALGDMSGYSNGHQGIIEFIIQEKG